TTPPPILHSFPTRRSSDLAFSSPPISSTWPGMMIPEERSFEVLIDSTEVLFSWARSHRVSPVSTVWLAASALYARVPDTATAARSEEHTSELQSRFDLVCR